MDHFQSIETGKPELKDNYESMYEAIRRRRKKNLEKLQIDEDDQVDRDPYPKVD